METTYYSASTTVGQLLPCPASPRAAKPAIPGAAKTAPPGAAKTATPWDAFYVTAWGFFSAVAAATAGVGLPSADLKFLNNQYFHKVRSLKKDSKAKTEKIQQLQEKNLQAVVQTPGGKKITIPFRRQRMQIDQTIPPSFVASMPVPRPDDPYVVDLLQVADNREHFVYKNSLLASRAGDYCTAGGSNEAELMQVVRERDELQAMLDRFEVDIQANVKVLTAERDQLSMLCEQTQGELNRLRKEAIRSPKSQKSVAMPHAVLHRVDKGRKLWLKISRE
ncbi:UNVERIFIED_CONTAM: hypothetical protein FKN15_043051 [Acipenser sinensis]